MDRTRVLELGPSKEGEAVRVNHAEFDANCTGSSKSAVLRYENGSVGASGRAGKACIHWFCHRCHRWGSVVAADPCFAETGSSSLRGGGGAMAVVEGSSETDGGVGGSTRPARRATRIDWSEIESGGPSEVKDWPSPARRWLLGYVGNQVYVNEMGALYYNRCVWIPCRDVNGKVIKAPGRCFGTSGQKYTTAQGEQGCDKDRPGVIDTNWTPNHFHIPKEGKTLVLVEDMVSAWVVSGSSEGWATLPLLSSNIPRNWRERVLELSGEYAHVQVWLDHDNMFVMKSARRIRKYLQDHGYEASLCRKGDPKRCLLETKGPPRA